MPRSRGTQRPHFQAVEEYTDEPLQKNGAATPLEIAGYIKPEGAKTYDDWQKVESATEAIRDGADLLLRTLNCSEVAEFFNENGFGVGKYCRRREWYGAMVRRFYKNPLLKGTPGRGFKHTIKHHETGRRISVPNPEGPIYVEFPELAHLDPFTFDTLNAALDSNNADFGRKPVDGHDPRWRVPRKRTRFPGQHARCWYCGRHFVWGANGMVHNLMCSGSREWRCWNSIGFEGRRLSRLLVDAIREELYGLDGFDSQFADLVREAGRDVSGDLDQRWGKLRGKEAAFHRDKENVAETIANTLMAYVRLYEQGKVDLAYPSVLARYAVAQIRAGRRVGTRLNTGDVLSEAARKRHGYVVQSLNGFDKHSDERIDATIEDTQTPVPDQAAFRCDFPAWLATHSRRDRRIAELLALGHSTGELAKRFKVSSGRVSQLRRELHGSWSEFHGEETID